MNKSDNTIIDKILFLFRVIPVQSPHSRKPATLTELSLSDVENIPRTQSPRRSSKASSIASNDVIARVQSPRRLSKVPGIVSDDGSITQSPSRRLPKVVKEVIVVEAFDDNSPGSREVSTRTFAVQSPARVICHSPSPKQELLQQNMAARIDVEKPKGIYFGKHILHYIHVVFYKHNVYKHTEAQTSKKLNIF